MEPRRRNTISKVDLPRGKNVFGGDPDLFEPLVNPGDGIKNSIGEREPCVFGGVPDLQGERAFKIHRVCHPDMYSVETDFSIPNLMMNVSDKNFYPITTIRKL